MKCYAHCSPTILLLIIVIMIIVPALCRGAVQNYLIKNKRLKDKSYRHRAEVRLWCDRSTAWHHVAKRGGHW